jgi:hypothetical protein
MWPARRPLGTDQRRYAGIVVVVFEAHSLGEPRLDKDDIDPCRGSSADRHARR